MRIETVIKPRIDKKDGKEAPYNAWIAIKDRGRFPSSYIYGEDGRIKGWGEGINAVERKFQSFGEAKRWIREKMRELEEYLDSWMHIFEVDEEVIEEWEWNEKTWKMKKVEEEVEADEEDVVI